MKQKYPFFKALTKPFTDIFDNFKMFLLYAGGAAVFLTLLSFAFSQTFLCSVSPFDSQISCSQNFQGYFIYFALKLLSVCVFLRLWYDVIYLEKKVDFSYFKNRFLSFLSFFFYTVIFLILNALPALSLALLVARVPNPNFVIELCYFTVVSLGFVVPFVLIRFYKNLACLIEGLPFTDFKKTLVQTSFKTSKIVFSFVLVLALCLFLFLTIVGNLRLHVFMPLMAYNIFAEFLFELVAVFIFTVFIGFIRTQKEIFE